MSLGGDMFKIADIVRHKYNIQPDVFGIVIGIDGHLYRVKWFDGVDSKEYLHNVLEVQNG
jgi:hypothetical protein